MASEYRWRRDMILVAVSLDPHTVQEAHDRDPLWEWGLPDHGSLRGKRPFARPWLRLDGQAAAHPPRPCRYAVCDLADRPRGHCGWTHRLPLRSDAGHSERPAMVQGRDHLPAAHQVLLRRQQRRHRRFPRPALKLDYIADLGVNTIWLLPFYPSPRRDDGYDIADYRGVHPDYGTLQESALHRRGACARHAGDHRTGDQPHLRPASVVPARAPGQARFGVSATFMSGRTMTTNTPERASSSSTPNGRTGRGTRWRAPTTGTDSIRISRT